MPNLEYEHKYIGYIVAGVDEAGRGPLAGPVVASAVIIDQKNIIPGIKDSKQLSQKKRELLYNQIISNYQWAIGIISSEEIDKINILQATKKASIQAVKKLNITPDIILIDGNMKFEDQNNFKSIIKGDSLSISIAAASIIAKVSRDLMMREFDKDFPEYKWNKNFGYGTTDHLLAIEKYGLSMHHRKSFKIKTLNPS